jgi:hypothetical protein
MNQNTMLRPALIGGVLLGIFSAIPPLSFFNCACCAWVIGGGVLAAQLYVKSSPHVVTLGTGVGLGLLTGAIGGIVSTIFGIPVQMLMNSVFAEYAGQARRMISELPNLPPIWRDMILSSGQAGFSLLAVVIAGFVNVVVYALFAMLGGVLGVAIFEKRKIQGPDQAPPPPVHIPPPPPPDYPEQ